MSTQKIETPQTPRGLAIIRLDVIHIENFKGTLGANAINFVMSNTVTEVLSSNIETIEGHTWPTEKCIAMLNFPNVESATQWFDTLNKDPQPWLQTADVIVVQLERVFDRAKGLLAMVNIKVYDMNKFLTGYLPGMYPIMLEYGGERMLGTKDWMNVKGDWIPSGNFLVLFLWPTAPEHVREFWNGDRYAPYKTLRQEFSETSVWLFPRIQG